MRTELPLVGPLERTLHLRSLQMFAKLRPQEVAIFAQLMSERLVPRGTVLYQEGEPPRMAYFLVDGSVREERQGRRLVRREAPAGVGISGIFGGPRAASRGVAETDLVVLEMEASVFVDLIEDHFGIFLHLRRLLAGAVYELQRELGTYRTLPPLGLDSPDYPDKELQPVERLLWLYRNPVLADVSLELLAELTREKSELRLGEGAEIWAEGTGADFMLSLVYGSVHCAAADDRGAFRAGPGALLGLDAAFGGVPHAYSARTETPIVAIRIDARRLTDLVEDHFELGLLGLAYLARARVQLLQERADRQANPGLRSGAATAFVVDV